MSSNEKLNTESAYLNTYPYQATTIRIPVETSSTSDQNRTTSNEQDFTAVFSITMSSEACKICDDILSCFTQPDSEREINFGSWEEGLANPCQRHKKLLTAFSDHCKSREFHNPDSVDVGIIKCANNNEVSMYESISELGFTWGLLLAHDTAVPNHSGNGRLLDPDWVDLETVQKWKDMCSSEHGARCQNPMRVPPIKPAWVVDTEKRCLVPGESIDKYAALSYRWGDTQGFRVDDEAVLTNLQREYALDDSHLTSAIPLMIRHAISLTRLIGERYLWVDALCIIHAGHVSTIEQLNLMAAIYANADITIIAADGTSTDGIHGLKDISDSRQMEQKIIPFGDENILVRNTDIFALEHGTDYYERAWTYQEYKMAPRQIVFNSKEVHWQCQCKVWHEELILGTTMASYIDTRLRVLVAGFPDVSSLDNVIAQYNERALTYSEDAPSGIAGLLAFLSRTFKGGFLHGCPEMFFERGLSWTPLWSHDPLTRRKPSGNPLKGRVSSDALPSWSWLGWQGRVSMRYGEAVRINNGQSWMEEIIPITEWFTARSPTSTSRRRIHSTWYENRDKYKDRNWPVPDGWTRHEAPEDTERPGEPLLYPDGCGQFIFKHQDMPDDICPSWYYPFPVAKTQPSDPFFTPEQTPYLFCKTSKARIWTERVDYVTFPDGPYRIKIRQEAGSSVIGELNIHTEEDLDQWPKVEKEEPMPPGRMVDVVAICRSIVYSKVFNKETQHYDGGVTREEKYVVLWVSWEDGVAYRRGCGQIDRDAWEGFEKEEIDLVLG